MFAEKFHRAVVIVDESFHRVESLLHVLAVSRRGRGNTFVVGGGRHGYRAFLLDVEVVTLNLFGGRAEIFHRLREFGLESSLGVFVTRHDIFETRVNFRQPRQRTRRVVLKVAVSIPQLRDRILLLGFVVVEEPAVIVDGVKRIYPCHFNHLP